MKIRDLIKEDIARLKEQTPNPEDPFATQGTPGQGAWSISAQDLPQMSPEQRQAAIAQQSAAAPRAMPTTPATTPDFALSAQQMQQMSPEQWQQYYPSPADTQTVPGRPSAQTPQAPPGAPTVPTGQQTPGGTNVLAYPDQTPSMPTDQQPQALQQYGKVSPEQAQQLNQAALSDIASRVMNPFESTPYQPQVSQQPSMPMAQQPQPQPQQYAAAQEEPIDPTVSVVNPLQRQEVRRLPTMKELFLRTKNKEVE